MNGDTKANGNMEMNGDIGINGVAAGKGNAAQRVEWLDLARGIGIVLVIYGHIVGGRYDFENSFWLKNLIFSFHMPLFFILSGFTLRTGDFGGSVRKRAARLLRPYLIWTALYLILFFLEDFAHKTEGNFAQTLRAMKEGLSLCGLAPLWFLLALFVSSLAAEWLMTRLSRAKLMIAELGFVAVTFLLRWGYGKLGGGSEWILLNLQGVLRILPIMAFLLFGNLLKPYLYRDQSPWVSAGICLGSSALFWLLVTRFPEGMYDIQYFMMGNPILYYAKGIAGSMAVLSFAGGMGRFRLWKPVGVLGRDSLSLMILHYPPFLFIAAFAGIVNRFLYPGAAGSFLILGAVLFCCEAAVQILKRLSLYQILF